MAVVSATSTSVDGRPGNNDGSSPNAIVTTVVDAAPPANQPPVVDDVSFDWIPTQRLTGVVPMSDPDAGQVVTASLTTPPAHGTATVGPDGAFEWVPTGAFTGIDTFVVTGCDNGSPSLCDTGTVTITVEPLPADDTATTTDGVPINVDVGRQRPRRHRAPTVVSGPANGTTTVEADGSITYSPTPGFTGTDTFDYEVCSTVSPTICGQATVTVEVGAAPNQPPAVGDADGGHDRDASRRPGRDRQRPGCRADGDDGRGHRAGERHRHDRRQRGVHVHALRARSPGSTRSWWSAATTATRSSATAAW